MRSFLIVALGLAILAVTFALQNTIPVGVTVLVWKFEGSLALVLMLKFALGFSDFVAIDSCYSKKTAGPPKSLQECSGEAMPEEDA